MGGLCPERRRGPRSSGSADEMLNSINDGHALVTRGEKHLDALTLSSARARAEMGTILRAPSASQETRVQYQNIYFL